MIIVRDPFERLLSAYRDKIENRFKHEYYYQRFSKLMFNNNNKLIINKVPTFIEFIKYLIKINKNNNNLIIDEHFKTYFNDCSPCSIQYDYILKLDGSFNYEFNYFIYNYFNITTIVNNNYNNKINDTILYKYYSQLNHELLNQLYQIYQIDFQLFNYSPNKYFNYVATNNHKQT